MPSRRPSPRAPKSKAQVPARPRRLASPAIPAPPGPFALSRTQALVQRIHVPPPRLGDLADDAAIATAEGISALYAAAAQPSFGAVLVPGQASDAESTHAELRASMSRAFQASQAVAKVAGLAMTGVEPLPVAAGRVGVALTGTRKGDARAPAWGGGKVVQGDVLVLTQAVGTGVALTAVQQGLRGAPFAKRVQALWQTPHSAAGEVLLRRRAAIRSVVVLGEGGLLAALEELSKASKMRVMLLLEQVPLVEEVPSLAAEGVLPEAATSTLERLTVNLTLPEGLPPEVPFVLASPEVNGGLLAVVPAKEAPRLLRLLDEAGAFGAVIGALQRGAPAIDVG